MDDFKKRFLLKKTESKKERNKNGNEYKPYQKYFPENIYNDLKNDDKEIEINLLNKNEF